MRPQPNRRELSLSMALAILVALQTLVSFGGQWLVLGHFGAGREADAYYAAATIPQVVITILADTLGFVLVPMLAAVSREESASLTWLYLVLATSVFGLLGLLFRLTSGWWLPLLIPGFPPESKALTSELLNIHLASMIGSGCTAVLTAYQQVRRNFLRPPMAILAGGVVSFTLIVTQLEGRGITFVAWAQVLAFTLPAVLLLPGLKLAAPPVRIFQQLKSFLQQFRPLALGKTFLLLGIPLDRILVSFLAPGTLVIFEVVSRFNAAVLRVLTQGLLTPRFPQLSELAHGEDWQAFEQVYRTQVRMTFLIGIGFAATVAGGAMALVFAKPALNAWVTWGRISFGDIERIALMAASLSAGIPCGIVIGASSNAYYAHGDTVTPSRISVIAAAIGMAMKVAGFLAGGFPGMIIALTVWVAGTALLSHWLLLRAVRARGRQRRTELNAQLEEVLSN